MIFRLLVTSSAIAILWVCSISNDPTHVTTQSPLIVATPFTVKLIGFKNHYGNLELPGTSGTGTAVALADHL